MCVFCNQRSISGKQSFDRESVADEIRRALSTISADEEVEIAYFGGSFTGIDRELMIYLLDLAQSFIDSPEEGHARVIGIRMSTRPDYISDGIMEILSRYTVRTVELGLQSMDDRVLSLCRRGHTSAQAELACRMIKERGYRLIGQMMIGLPGSDRESELMTAKRICDLGADGARIYPTVTFYDTELSNMAERGEYIMLSNEDAVIRSCDVLEIFEEHGVDCIRIGLCSSDNLGDTEKVKGGANHPALGELVRGELYFRQTCRLIEEVGKTCSLEERTVELTVPRGEISKAIGQRGRNRTRMTERYGLKKLVIKEKDVPGMVLAVTE